MRNLRKEKTIYCPNSDRCFETKNKPYFQNKFMLLEENQKYKEVINKIKSICDKVPYDWSVCGIEVVHKIENILKEVEHEKSND